MTNKEKLYATINTDMLYDVMQKILVQIGVSPNYFPSLELTDFSTRDFGLASYRKNENVISIDIAEITNFDKLIAAMLHECEHVWQGINYPEILDFFGDNRELYIATYSGAFNLPESDAYTVQYSHSRMSLRGMFEIYDLDFFRNHADSWDTQAPSMLEAYRKVVEEEEHRQNHPMVNFSDHYRSLCCSQFLEYQKVFDFYLK